MNGLLVTATLLAAFAGTTAAATEPDASDGVKAGVGFDYFENKASAKWLDSKPTPEEISLTLDGTSRFQVRALDSAGKPIAGVVFLPWTLQKPEKNEYINLSGAPSDFPVCRACRAWS